MTSLLVLIMHGASLAPWIRPFLAFRWSLAARALLRAHSLARRVEQATKLMDPACGEPGSAPCRTPNTPIGARRSPLFKYTTSIPNYSITQFLKSLHLCFGPIVFINTIHTMII